MGLTSAVAQDIQGNAAAGAQKNALCMGCHGIRGFHTAFPQVHRVPMLSGQSEQYIGAALHAYKAGERKHPSMRTLAKSLSDQDIADLAAYYANSAPASIQPTAATTADNAAARELVNKGACTSCHGDNFSKPLAPNYPKIAGQHSDYLYVALRAYKTTDKPMIGRGNPIMGGVVQQFSNDELKVIANYIGSLQTELATVQPSSFK